MKRKQRFFKLSAIVGCILLGAGILLCGAGFVAMGCDLDAFIYPRGGESVEVSSFVVEDAVDSIEVHASMGDVKIERASAANPEDVEIILAENVYEVVVQHGLLLVTPQKSVPGQSGWNWYQLLNFNSDGDWNVTIRVPEKLLDSVYVESGMGAIHVSDLEAANVTVQGDMGDVTLDNVAASESLTVTQSMGRVTVENCQSGDLTLENDMGDTELSSGSFTEGEITASAGSVGVAGSTFTTLTVENDMGDVNLSATQVSEAVSCAVNMGSIGLDQLASPAITLDADSGNVTGTIAGRQEDYQITVETDLGDSNLQNQLGEGSHLLQVTTNMGNISLDFAE